MVGFLKLFFLSLPGNFVYDLITESFLDTKTDMYLTSFWNFEPKVRGQLNSLATPLSSAPISISFSREQWIKLRQAWKEFCATNGYLRAEVGTGSRPGYNLVSGGTYQRKNFQFNPVHDIFSKIWWAKDRSPVSNRQTNNRGTFVWGGTYQYL